MVAQDAGERDGGHAVVRGVRPTGGSGAPGCRAGGGRVRGDSQSRRGAREGAGAGVRVAHAEQRVALALYEQFGGPGAARRPVVRGRTQQRPAGRVGPQQGEEVLGGGGRTTWSVSAASDVWFVTVRSWPGPADASVACAPWVWSRAITVSVQILARSSRGGVKSAVVPARAVPWP